MSTVIEKMVKSEHVPALRNATGLLSVLSTLDLFKNYKEEAAVVIDKIGKMVAVEGEKKKKDPRIDKVQVFLDLLQKNVS